VLDRLKVNQPVPIISRGDPMPTMSSQEILKVRAFQVAPAELEGHLLRHPDVADAARPIGAWDTCPSIHTPWCVVNPLR
jgi:hypothetical protein